MRVNDSATTTAMVTVMRAGNEVASVSKSQRTVENDIFYLPSKYELKTLSMFCGCNWNNFGNKS